MPCASEQRIKKEKERREFPRYWRMVDVSSFVFQNFIQETLIVKKKDRKKKKAKDRRILRLKIQKRKRNNEGNGRKREVMYGQAVKKKKQRDCKKRKN